MALTLSGCLSSGSDGSDGSQGERGPEGEQGEAGPTGQDGILGPLPTIALKKTQVDDGIMDVTISWNHEDYDSLVPEICAARELIIDMSNCKAHTGSRHYTEIDSDATEVTLSDLPLGQVFWIQLRLADTERAEATGQAIDSDQSIVSTYAVSPTGIDYWATMDETLLDQPQQLFPDQDGDHGVDPLVRDFPDTYLKVGSGSAGFDWIGLDANGEEVALDSDQADCVQDHATGLVWEQKLEDADHYRYRGHTYSWYDQDSSQNADEPGVADGGSCDDIIDCDTESYMSAMNDESVCGRTDWRLPTHSELQGIVHYGVFDPAIDPVAFPNTSPNSYWTATSYGGDPLRAWRILFSAGNDMTAEKSQEIRVRAVSDGS